MKKKIVVVGANHAGTAAIKTICSNYPENEVVVFDKNNNISFLGCGMALWIGGDVEKGESLFYSSKEDLEQCGAKIHMETEITKIDFHKKIVYAKSLKYGEIEESYDKLILATGSIPIKPNVPGKDLVNVQQVKLYQNAQEVIDKIKTENIENVVVVGGGYIGVELVEAFKKLGKKVELIDLNGSCLTGYYDEEFRNLMVENLKKNGIGVNFGEKVLEITGKTEEEIEVLGSVGTYKILKNVDDKKVEYVITDKKKYKADMVILAVGFLPNNLLGKNDLKLFRNGAYEVDLMQRTSNPDVYAVGDCATIFDNSINDKNYIALATNAVRTGIIAAHNACGTHLPGIGVQGSNGISIFGLNMVSTGLTEEKAKKLGFDVSCVSYEDNQRPEFMKKNDKVCIKIVYDKRTRRIMGAQLASREDISMMLHMFSLAIQEKVTIDKLKLLDIFFLPHFNKPYNYVTMSALSAK